MKLIIATVFLLMALPFNGHASEIKLATTTSTEASGLLGLILPQFEKASGVKVKVISVGTGQALKLAERGDVDVLLVHSRPDEDKYMAAGFGTVRRDVMYNDFIIVGPKSDVAKLRGEKNASAALRRIAQTESKFISRGDDSGTHKKELSLWQEVSIVPKGKWYLEVGQGMGETLTMAGNMGAYTLTDRGTFLAHRARLGLEVIVSQVPGLFNPYGIMDVNPAKQADALKLIEWIVSPAGRMAILSLKVDGASLFTPGAAPKD